MRSLSFTCAVLPLVLAGFGSAHSGYYTFSNTRKLLESDAMGITKVCFSPLLVVGETVATPVTTYMDAAEYSSERDHVYLSYLGMKALVVSKMNGFYKFIAGT